MPHSLPQRSGGFRDYEKDAPITVFGCMQAKLVGECPGGAAQLAWPHVPDSGLAGMPGHFLRDCVTFLQEGSFLKELILF